MAGVQVTFVGEMFYSGLGVDGGPMPGGPHPSHPIAPGGSPPSVWPSPGVPTHPIAGSPPSIWPSPGYPSHPIAPGGSPPSVWPSPGVPTHPIYYPPIIWPSPGVPTHPIAGEGREPLIDWKVGWSPSTGWIVVGIPGGPSPTPSKETTTK